MTTQSTETQLALLAAGLKEITRELDEVKAEGDQDRARMNAKIAALEDERNKALKWGVGTLGAAVMGMAYWIFDKVVGGHIR
ncbi:hypothetical protein CR105_27270 [Massilia eurypsychrophila]|uniref:Uncharacterized protein n=1 Tax=Massilia eurypsychrophila TaxID=1485217 RepID=A0A2G8T7E7_9BURK|nr:hypothetical protein [Massilia eurypsychrophila]PIL41893.1 hypothetical protein CR105_27270 [Massilia eurypsychrophila]